MRRRRPPGVLAALHKRELGVLELSSMRASATAALVPSHAFHAVAGAPNASLRRFTPCGRFLVAFDRNQTDVLLLRLETGAPRPGADPTGFAATPLPQNPVRAGSGFLQPPPRRSALSRTPADSGASGSAVVPPAAVVYAAESAPSVQLEGADPALFGPQPHLATQAYPVYRGNPNTSRRAVSAAAAVTADAGSANPFPAGSRLNMSVPVATSLNSVDPSSLPNTNNSYNNINNVNAAGPPRSITGSNLSSSAMQHQHHLSQHHQLHHYHLYRHQLEGQQHQQQPPNGLLNLLPFPIPHPGPDPTPATLPLPEQHQQQQQNTRQSTGHETGNRTQTPVDSHTCAFSRFFTLMHNITLALNSEVLVRDFCFATSEHLIFASVQIRTDPEFPPPPTTPPAVASVPSLERVVLYLVHTESGEVRDSYVLPDDFIPLEGHAGVHMHRNLLCVLSVREQTLHVLRVQDSISRLMPVARIGNHCNPDDELEIARARDAELRANVPDASDRCATSRAGSTALDPGEGTRATRETGLGNGKGTRGFYTGLMQRLLVHVFKNHQQEQNERLFFRVVGQYSMLVMLKAQLLDENHLLIRLGSLERNGKAPDPSSSTCFLVVYCMSTMNIVNLYENRSAELLSLFETHRELFLADPSVAAMLPPHRLSPSRLAANATQSHSNSAALEQNQSGAPGTAPAAGGTTMSNRRARSLLAALPVTVQLRNPSAYLDRRLFSYAEDRMMALDGSRPLSMRECSSIKFIAAGGGGLRFKLTPGGNGGAAAGAGPARDRRKALFLFHPYLPFVISMQLSTASPMLNFHLRGAERA
jgi:de-etiolated-1